MFGYHTFHGKEIDTVYAILSKNYGVVLMPTGGEKTVCYAVPRVIPPGVTLALIVDQVQCLHRVGLNVLSSFKYEGKGENGYLSQPNYA